MLSQILRKQFRLSISFMLAILILTGAGCDGNVGIDSKTRDLIQHAIDLIEKQPSAWQNTMLNTIDELGRVGTDTAHKVLADVQSVYNDALGQTGEAQSTRIRLPMDRPALRSRGQRVPTLQASDWQRPR